jgi:hypothetical protein
MLLTSAGMCIPPPVANPSPKSAPNPARPADVPTIVMQMPGVAKPAQRPARLPRPG